MLLQCYYNSMAAQIKIVADKIKMIYLTDFSSYLPLHIVNSAAGSIGVGAIVFVVNLLDGVIHLFFYLKRKALSLLSDCNFYVLSPRDSFSHYYKTNLQYRPLANTLTKQDMRH